MVGSSWHIHLPSRWHQEEKSGAAARWLWLFRSNSCCPSTGTVAVLGWIQPHKSRRRWHQAGQFLPLLHPLHGNGSGQRCSAGSFSLGLAQLPPWQPGHPHWSWELGQEGSQKHLEGRTWGHRLVWDGRDIKPSHSRDAIVCPGTAALSCITLCIPIKLGIVNNLKHCTLYLFFSHSKKAHFPSFHNSKSYRRGFWVFSTFTNNNNILRCEAQIVVRCKSRH